jgi:2-oxoglutarate ferredoxin oxidoreductase subunit alpha
MKQLIKGNIALCEGAIAAGVKAYFGYPITPQNEVPAHMSKRMVELGRVFLQAESELAAINMVLGAAATGMRAMTSSSSPGVSLKQEGISYLTGMEIPCVIVNVMRGGPGLGNIAASQSDYFQAVKGGGHGDYKMIVLAPSNAQEMYDLTYQSFALAEKYRNPVMILSDGIVGQMMEPIEIADHCPASAYGSENRDWVLDGCKGREPRSLHSLLMMEGELEEHNLKLQKKYAAITAKEKQVETEFLEDADQVVVAFGIAGRIAKSAVRRARELGIKAGLIRPITLWPFPSDTIAAAAKPGTNFLVVEMNAGQMVEDVRLAVNGKAPVEFYGRAGGGVVDEEVIKRLQAK